MLTAAEYVVGVSVCMCFKYKLTDFPVPGFQWYPNTNSRFTVLLLSTSVSSSSWEEKDQICTENQKQLFQRIKEKLYSTLPSTVVGSVRAQGNH